MSFSSDPDMDYLTPGFDPSTLTVPRLRSILVSHDINYPASAKKAQLVEIFNNKVVPQSRKILSARSRAKRSSRGIIDVESSHESTASGDADMDLMPPPALPEYSRRRTSPRIVGAEVEENGNGITALPESRMKSFATRSANKHPRESDTEMNLNAEPKRPMVRKSRQSDIAPSEGVEEHSEPAQRPPLGDSVFSDDNPFQSGSSPLSGGDRRLSAGKRKKSLGLSTAKEGARRRSSNKVIKAEDGIVVPTSKKFEVPITRVKTEPEYPEDVGGIEPGEEFTPEEQMELTREQLKNGARDIVPAKRQKNASSGNGLGISAPWVILLTLLVGYATWWRKEKLDVGYCGIGRPSTSLTSVHIPDWADVLHPQCEPCPQHAYCYESLQTKCEPDFVLKPHPLSLGGIIPLPPTCEPDGEKVRKVKAVADRAIEELRERRAKHECGEPIDDMNKNAPVEMDEEELKSRVGQKRKRAMSDAEFEDLWKGAIGEILGRDEVVAGVDGVSGRRTVSSTSLVRLSLACALRRSARLTLARYRIELGGLVMLIFALLSARSYLQSLHHAKARVPDLVKLTLDRLATHAALHAQDPRAVPEPWISVGQLRDDVLRDEFSVGRREELWKRVRAVVEANANIRASVREGRGGEVSRVWEWIGSIGLLEDGYSSSGRRASARPSLISASAMEGSSPSPAPEQGRQLPTTMMQRWDEGRPIY